MATQAQSTDRVSATTAIKQSNILKRGSFTITLSTAEATGISGHTSISLSQFAASLGMPVVEVMIDRSGGGTTSYWKTPFNEINTNGSTASSAYFVVNYTTNSDFSLDVYMYHRTATINTAYDGSYIVRSETWANPNDPPSSY